MQKDEADPLDAAPRLRLRDEMFQRGSKVTVDGLPEEPGRREFERSHNSDKRQCQDYAPLVWAQILHQTAHQPCVVSFTEFLFFVNIAHARSSSSSSNCF